MTIAIDRATGEVVGQVLESLQRTEGLGPDEVLVLNLSGYKVLPASSVRLEVVR